MLVMEGVKDNNKWLSNRRGDDYPLWSEKELPEKWGKGNREKVD